MSEKTKTEKKKQADSNNNNKNERRHFLEGVCFLSVTSVS